MTNLERYERIAPFYDLLDLPFEHGRYRRIRPLLFRGLSGHLLDAGVGTGRNAPYYPAGCSIVAIDASPAMLARAERRRHLAASPVELRRMDVTRLDFPDNSFDAAVALAAAKAMLRDPHITVSEIARRLGVVSSTLYRHLPKARSAAVEDAP